jgi:hypothetical protein
MQVFARFHWSTPYPRHLSPACHNTVFAHIRYYIHPPHPLPRLISRPPPYIVVAAADQPTPGTLVAGGRTPWGGSACVGGRVTPLKNIPSQLPAQHAPFMFKLITNFRPCRANHHQPQQCSQLNATFYPLHTALSISYLSRTLSNLIIFLLHF